MILGSCFKGYRDYGNTVGQAHPTVLNPEWPSWKERGTEGAWVSTRTWCLALGKLQLSGFGQCCRLQGALESRLVQTATTPHISVLKHLKQVPQIESDAERTSFNGYAYSLQENFGLIMLHSITTWLLTTDITFIFKCVTRYAGNSVCA